MKKIFSIILVLFLSNTMNASINKLALEIARSKQVDVSIQRVNAMYDYINLYIMQKSVLPANFAALLLEYPGLINVGYSNINTIDFSINPTTNIVLFTNIVPSNLSNLSAQLYENNQYLLSNAKINNAPLYNMEISLKSETKQFLSRSALLIENDLGGVVQIQGDAPACNNPAQQGTLWYRPNGEGKYYIYTCLSTSGVWQWNYITNKIDIAIYQDTFADLSDIKPLVGTRAYVRDTATKVKEYIYSGVINGWMIVSTP